MHNPTMADLQKVAEALNKESDTLTRTVADFEDQLVKLNLGLSGWVTLSNRLRVDDGVEYIDRRILGFAEHRGRWRLWVETDTYRGDDLIDEGDPRPLMESSRAERIAAVGQFQELIGLLKRSADEALDTIRKAQA